MIDGIALADARTTRGISQRQLARLVGLNFQVIRRLEAGGNDGNLTLRDFARICTTLNVTPATLLMATDQPTPDKDQQPTRSSDELDLGQARLLRRIQRGVDVRRSLSTDERQLVLPTLLKQHLIGNPGGGHLTLTARARTDLADPESFDRGAGP